MFTNIIYIFVFLLFVPVYIRFYNWIKNILDNNTDISSNTVDWSNITVRVLTVGNYENIIQKTVNSLSDTNAEIQVISENMIDIENADVYVVPKNYESDAQHKGRALEWARENLNKRDYILFLDEDSNLKTRENIPQGDMVQLRQIPQYSGSLLCWYAEAQRMGVAKEIYSFDPDNPDYIWGGGLLIKSKIEDEITWNRKSITEDGDFIRKALDNGYKYHITKKPQIENKSPSSFKSILEQRRRWNSKKIPVANKIKSILKLDTSYVWSINSLFPVFILLFILMQNIYSIILLIPLFMINSIWIYFGLKYMRANIIHYIIAIMLTPIVSFYNGAGNLYAIFNPAIDFKQTSKN